MGTEGSEGRKCESFRDVAFHDAEVISVRVGDDSAVVVLSGLRLLDSHVANQSGTTIALDRATLRLRGLVSCRLSRFDDELGALVLLENTSALLRATIVRASCREMSETLCTFSFEGWSVALDAWVECQAVATSASIMEGGEPE